MHDTTKGTSRCGCLPPIVVEIDKLKKIVVIKIRYDKTFVESWTHSLFQCQNSFYHIPISSFLVYCELGRGRPIKNASSMGKVCITLNKVSPVIIAERCCDLSSVWLIGLVRLLVHQRALFRLTRNNSCVVYTSYVQDRARKICSNFQTTYLVSEKLSVVFNRCPYGLKVVHHWLKMINKEKVQLS